VKGDGKCYFPCNDCRGLQTRRILITTTEKHCREKGHVEGGYEYHPLVRHYSIYNVFFVIVIMSCICQMFYHFNICSIHTNFNTLFVNIKTMPPKCRPPESYFPSSSINTTLQGEEHGDQNIEDRVLNDDMDGDNVIDTNQEDEIHRLIQDTFAPMDEDNQDDIHDVDPLLEKSRQPLYEGSTTNLLSSILLLVNLKVLNGLSNTCLTQILRYVMYYLCHDDMYIKVDYFSILLLLINS
jgi:hypothetical protein